MPYSYCEYFLNSKGILMSTILYLIKSLCIQNKKNIFYIHRLRKGVTASLIFAFESISDNTFNRHFTCAFLPLRIRYNDTDVLPKK